MLIPYMILIAMEIKIFFWHHFLIQLQLPQGFMLWGDGVTFTKESYGYNLASKASCSFDLNSDGNVDIFLSDSSGSNLGGWVPEIRCKSANISC